MPWNVLGGIHDNR